VSFQLKPLTKLIPMPLALAYSSNEPSSRLHQRPRQPQVGELDVDLSQFPFNQLAPRAAVL
jgi:hypothetical protein